MEQHDDFSKEVVKLEDSPVEESSDAQSLDADAAAVEKLGLAATLPRKLTKTFTLVGLNSSVLLPWPAVYFFSQFNLVEGGTAGLLMASCVTVFFMSFVYLSLAEKLRKFPTAGGQYHWVAALAPPRWRRLLSFCCGIMLCFTWISNLISSIWSTAVAYTAIILIYTGEYHVKTNFGISAAMCVFVLVVNCSWGHWINYVERGVLVIQIVGFFVVVGLLASYAGAPGTPNTTLAFTSQSGWSPGVASALGVIYTTTALIGFDCASHISEDTIDAKRQLPRSLVIAMTGNGISCIILAVVIVLCAGDVKQLFAGPLALSGHPLGGIVQLTFNAARGNKSLASAPFGLIIPLAMVSISNTTAAASRLVYSFIRDDCNPAVQRVMGRDFRPDHVPRITICLVALSPLLILWINFYSAVGFQALLSQVVLSLTTTYLMAIGSSLYSRFRWPDVLGRERRGTFQLGTRWGSVVDILAIVFLIYIWVFSWFPATVPIMKNLTNLNFAPIIVAGVVVLSLLYYVVYARKHYRNPAPKGMVGESEES